jgi:hypothetical protein
MARRMLKATIPGYYSRVQAHRILVDALGLENDSHEFHRLYRDLKPIFSEQGEQGVNRKPIGSGGQTQRLQQVHHEDLYRFTKQTYGIEINEWKPKQSVQTEQGTNEDERINEITILLKQLDKGRINQDVFINAVRDIVRETKKNLNETTSKVL